MSDASSTTRPPIAAAVIVRPGEALLIRRRQREGMLLWAFPSGEVEAGESPEQAAEREANEELNILVRAESVIGSRVHPQTGRTMYYIACRMESASGPAEIRDVEELAELRWCTSADVDQLTNGTVYEPVRTFLRDTL